MGGENPEPADEKPSAQKPETSLFEKGVKAAFATATIVEPIKQIKLSSPLPQPVSVASPWYTKILKVAGKVITPVTLATGISENVNELNNSNTTPSARVGAKVDLTLDAIAGTGFIIAMTIPGVNVAVGGTVAAYAGVRGFSMLAEQLTGKKNWSLGGFIESGIKYFYPEEKTPPTQTTEIKTGGGIFDFANKPVENISATVGTGGNRTEEQKKADELEAQNAKNEAAAKLYAQQIKEYQALLANLKNVTKSTPEQQASGRDEDPTPTKNPVPIKYEVQNTLKNKIDDLPKEAHITTIPTDAGKPAIIRTEDVTNALKNVIKEKTEIAVLTEITHPKQRAELKEKHLEDTKITAPEKQEMKDLRKKQTAENKTAFKEMTTAEHDLKKEEREERRELKAKLKEDGKLSSEDHQELRLLRKAQKEARREADKLIDKGVEANQKVTTTNTMLPTATHEVAAHSK